jgi:hypothetical protein
MMVLKHRMQDYAADLRQAHDWKKTQIAQTRFALWLTPQPWIEEERSNRIGLTGYWLSSDEIS